MREGPIKWTTDLNGTTATNAIPTAVTDGVAIASQFAGRGGRVIIMARLQCTSTVASQLSGDIHVYGYAADNATTPGWGWIGSLNRGQPITANTVKGADTSTAAFMEPVAYMPGTVSNSPHSYAFPVYAENYTRIATRAVMSVNHILTTWVGVPTE